VGVALHGRGDDSGTGAAGEEKMNSCTVKLVVWRVEEELEGGGGCMVRSADLVPVDGQ